MAVRMDEGYLDFARVEVYQHTCHVPVEEHAALRRRKHSEEAQQDPGAHLRGGCQAMPSVLCNREEDKTALKQLKVCGHVP